MIAICNHCGTRVVLSDEGVCPACRLPQSNENAGDGEEVSNSEASVPIRPQAPTPTHFTLPEKAVVQTGDHDQPSGDASRSGCLNRPVWYLVAVILSISLLGPWFHERFATVVERSPLPDLIDWMIVSFVLGALFVASMSLITAVARLAELPNPTESRPLEFVFAVVSWASGFAVIVGLNIEWDSILGSDWDTTNMLLSLACAAFSGGAGLALPVLISLFWHSSDRASSDPGGGMGS